MKELQTLDTVTVEIFQDGKAEDGVDNQLMRLAKQYNGAVCTIDYNLNKVANVEGIQVLNVNDLAMSLRMAYLPGEKILLELTQVGHDSHQAIGHLADGTMVVVEQASQFVGKTIEIEFIRSLQTAAGKMMFARPVARVTKETKAKPAPKTVIEQSQPRPKAKSQKGQGRKPRDQQQPHHDQTGHSEHQERERSLKQPKQARVNTTSGSSRTNNPNNRRRPNHEDNLIDLISTQDEK